jgi:hypothetical protein
MSWHNSRGRPAADHAQDPRGRRRSGVAEDRPGSIDTPFRPTGRPEATGSVATGSVATGSVATGSVATGSVATGTVGGAAGQASHGATRGVAAGAGLAVLGGALAMTVGLVAAPGSWMAGYVSEAGTAGMPAATAYRIGLLVLAVGVVALGAALRPAARLAALLLGIAGLLAGTSGAVPCSARCPLPPYEATTAADLLHSAASILGMAALAGAMLVLAVAPATRMALRIWALAGSLATFPLAAVMAFAMALAGRGPLTGAVERVLLAVAVCWLTGAAVVTARPRG